jgi:S-formylglutathione hydrolase FrmB
MSLASMLVAQDQVDNKLNVFEALLRRLEFLDITTIWWPLAFGVLALALIVLAVFAKPRWWLLAIVPAVLVVALIATGLYVNHEFKYKTTLGSLFGLSAYDTGTDENILHPEGPAPRGLVVDTKIPGNVSGVGDWLAKVWLPPQYFEDKNQTFPVVYLLHGVPTPPSPLIPPDEGPKGLYDPIAADNHALEAADQGHPVILVAVVNSPTNMDTECVDGVHGNWFTYLTVDVPKWTAQFPRFRQGAANTAVGGYSLGGYCAQIAALRNPSVYSVAANLSGTSKPDAAGGDSSLFGSSEALKEAVNYDSAHVVQTQPKSHSVRLWLEIGKQDEPQLVASQQAFAATAREAGMTVVTKQIDGAHTFPVWKAAFGEWIPWTAALLYGDTPPSVSQ